jgi:hypothetical protein
MNLISCDNCATVYDAEKLLWPEDLFDDSGSVVDLTKAAWDGDRHVAKLSCSHCGEDILKPTKPIPKCCVCGTTENLTKDGWHGYRCASADCVMF